MFDALTNTLAQDLATFKDLLDAHDCARANYESSPATPDPWAGIRVRDVRRTTWHIYDHCAAFTRLYAIYSTYVDDLIEEYLELLPSLYVTYNLLPGMITTQHRLGLATMLGKIGDDGTYRRLREAEIIAALSQAIAGGTPYKLITKAFLPERSNYRLEVVARLLNTLGIEEAANRISNDVDLKSFLRSNKPDTTIQSELEQFIIRRNEAAHSQVTEIVASDEVKFTADFIGHLGRAIAALLAEAVIARQHKLGQLIKLGTVEELAYGGRVVLTHLNRCMIRQGDRFAFGFNEQLLVATALELQVEDAKTEELIINEATEVGIRFGRKIKKGADIYALRDQQIAPYQILSAFERRKDDILAEVADRLPAAGVLFGGGEQLTLGEDENLEADPPKLLSVTDTHADLLLNLHISVRATVGAQQDALEEDEAKVTDAESEEEVARTVSFTAHCTLRFPDLAALANPESLTVADITINPREDANAPDLDSGDGRVAAVVPPSQATDEGASGLSHLGIGGTTNANEPRPRHPNPDVP
jgi:hypothetical protein